MIVDDPDAGDLPFVHWVHVYGIPGDTPSFTDNPDSVTQGVNDVLDPALEVGWFGPCPPANGPHRYQFTLYGLGEKLALPPGLNGTELLKRDPGQHRRPGDDHGLLRERRVIPDLCTAGAA